VVEYRAEQREASQEPVGAGQRQKLPLESMAGAPEHRFHGGRRLAGLVPDLGAGEAFGFVQQEG
jgi:hypothetical protein